LHDKDASTGRLAHLVCLKKYFDMGKKDYKTGLAALLEPTGSETKKPAAGATVVPVGVEQEEGLFAKYRKLLKIDTFAFRD
jgi:hypothetical protein